MVSRNLPRSTSSYMQVTRFAPTTPQRQTPHAPRSPPRSAASMASAQDQERIREEERRAVEEVMRRETPLREEVVFESRHVRLGTAADAERGLLTVLVVEPLGDMVFCMSSEGAQGQTKRMVLSSPYIRSLLSDRPQLLAPGQTAREHCAVEVFEMLKDSWGEA